MPGILPMKVIKVGTSAQSRIAQACDRCRSKKIRCDGVTPCCSQCANVGFECKTSDKLSRRAFPRGYTESLEERVRALEAEVRELKDLLDEKDEKIDMLSRIHSFSPQSRRSSSALPMPSVETKTPVKQEKDDTFSVQQSPFLIEHEKKSDPFFMGASSGRAFVDAFKSKAQENGKSVSNFNTNVFFTSCSLDSSSTRATELESARIPPCMLSDQLINVFFQEWAPLFPVLHRPTFLRLYSEYLANPDSIRDQQSIAQLHLVFAIAAISLQSDQQELANFESQWKPALDSIVSDSTLATLQCLILAEIYSISMGDYEKLLYYNGVAVNLSHRLGLHQSQKRFSLGALTRETRKKVFWSLYTLDCFSSASLGLPKLMNDEDIHTEYPSDVDDENLTERGFQPTLPGESTKLSSALALFRVSRIMSKVLHQVYPAASSHETSLQSIGALSDELDTWREELAPHLRLHFVQDKPSTNVVSSRCPLLSLAYYYVRTLIHRPVVGSSFESKTSSVVALADSSKHIIQIVQLLDERRMSFSFCLNKGELLLLSGFGLLFQVLDLKQEGKLIQDNQRLVCSVIEILERDCAPGATAFKKIACSIISVGRFAKLSPTTKNDSSYRRTSDGTMSPPEATKKSTRKDLQAIASRFSFSNYRSTKEIIKNDNSVPRRSTAPNPTGNFTLYSRHSSQISLPPSLSPIDTTHPLRRSTSTSTISPDLPNLDYFPFGNDPSLAPAISKSTSQPSLSDWEHLLCSTDADPALPYDNYLSPESLPSFIDASPLETTSGWSPDVWGIQDGFSQLGSAPAQSVFSVSEESLTSGEDLSVVDFQSEFRGIVMPNF